MLNSLNLLYICPDKVMLIIHVTPPIGQQGGFIGEDNIIEEKEVYLRNRDNFLIRHRAFGNLYLLWWVEQGRPYGKEMLEDFYKTFKQFNYKPNHSEVCK
ncbi:hypothetical protein [Bacillus salipaludis]|uniref:hypothetical protein n=1 Tax=Bacillus salipaludis TaxID=2547811 RepID=UPI0035569134